MLLLDRGTLVWLLIVILISLLKFCSPCIIFFCDKLLFFLISVCEFLISVLEFCSPNVILFGEKRL